MRNPAKLTLAACAACFAAISVEGGSNQFQYLSGLFGTLHLLTAEIDWKMKMDLSRPVRMLFDRAGTIYIFSYALMVASNILMGLHLYRVWRDF